MGLDKIYARENIIEFVLIKLEVYIYRKSFKG